MLVHIEFGFFHSLQIFNRSPTSIALAFTGSEFRLNVNNGLRSVLIPHRSAFLQLMDFLTFEDGSDQFILHQEGAFFYCPFFTDLFNEKELPLIMTTFEVSMLLRCSEEYVCRTAHEGRISFQKNGKNIVFRKRDVLSYLDENFWRLLTTFDDVLTTFFKGI